MPAGASARSAGTTVRPGIIRTPPWPTRKSCGRRSPPLADRLSSMPAAYPGGHSLFFLARLRLVADHEEIQYLEYPHGIDDEKRHEPALLTFAGGFPKRHPFPDQTPGDEGHEPGPAQGRPSPIQPPRTFPTSHQGENFVLFFFFLRLRTFSLSY